MKFRNSEYSLDFAISIRSKDIAVFLEHPPEELTVIDLMTSVSIAINDFGFPDMPLEFSVGCTDRTTTKAEWKKAYSSYRRYYHDLGKIYEDGLNGEELCPGDGVMYSMINGL